MNPSWAVLSLLVVFFGGCDEAAVAQLAGELQALAQGFRVA